MSSRKSLRRWLRSLSSSSSSSSSGSSSLSSPSISSSLSAPSDSHSHSPSPSLSSSSSSPIKVLRKFSLAEIIEATNNFDPLLLLWSSGWSNDVYKGTYHDENDHGIEKTVAIKTFHFEEHNNLDPPLERFHYLLNMCSQYSHKHVHSVIGYCHEPPWETYFIVYDYMENGSLANILSTRMTPTSFHLTSEQCLDICIDSARGLEYLHTQIKLPGGKPFIHGDVTISNIFLDENGVAKVSDIIDGYKETFFLVPQSRRFPVHQSSDVYAFGVLLVKVLSRKVYFDMEDNYIGKWFEKCIRYGTINRILHPEIKAQIAPDRLKTFLQIAMECLDGKCQNFTQVVKKLEVLKASTKSSRPYLCLFYSFREIEYVTNNFSTILGQGGEGKVYKGVTRSNVCIAVKCLKPERSCGFDKEITMLKDLNHPNLVSLVGYCDESDKYILIYEFMSNGNLAQRLYGKANINPLSWMQRLNICIGAARGLRYLHTHKSISQKGIIHRDVKPVNILLDENFNAQISDFGLSKIGPEGQAHSEITTMVKGTIGYYAPEYQQKGKITRQIDVYAFGVVLTEVLCKKKPWDREESFYPSENEKYGEWAKENMDPYLKGLIAPFCLEVFASILEKCLNVNPKKRPTMNDVVSMLEYAHKCQERYKPLADFCLPGYEDGVVLYYSSNLQQVTRTIQLRLLLQSFFLHVDERDTSKDLYAMELKYVLGNTIDIETPHVFIRGKYVGDDKMMNTLYKAGKLTELFGGHPHMFYCIRTGDATSCQDCRQTEWFVHCQKCDALSRIGELWKNKMRSCLECHGTQLMYGVNTERKQEQISQYISRAADLLTSMFQ